MRGISPSVCRSCVGVAGIGIGGLVSLSADCVTRERCSGMRRGKPAVWPVAFIVIPSDVSLVILLMLDSGLIAIRHILAQKCMEAA